MFILVFEINFVHFRASLFQKLKLTVFGNYRDDCIYNYCFSLMYWSLFMTLNVLSFNFLIMKFNVPEGSIRSREEQLSLNFVIKFKTFSFSESFKHLDNINEEETL